MIHGMFENDRFFINRMACAVLALSLPVTAVTETLPEEKPMPEFLGKVQLHNFAGVEPTEDGTGVKLSRLPKKISDQLDKETPNGKPGGGANQMLYGRNSEIRFVLNEGTTLGDVKLHLQATKGASLVFFLGDVLTGDSRLSHGGRAKPVMIYSHGLLNSLRDQLPRGAFANQVCRVVISGGEITFNGIEGDVRPPKPEELPPVMLSYGTSISMGAAASRSDLAWNALTARGLGYDLLNLGSSGSAYCEPAIADYMAGLKWDICVLEISVNMVGSFETEEFRKRATYMINTLATSHPQAPIVCISLFPYGTGDLWKNAKVKEYRETLAEIVDSSGHKNVHFVSGPDLLSFSGLSKDLLHPSDHGMIEISTKLVPRIKAFISKGKDQ
jgi:hypothetical protein